MESIQVCKVLQELVTLAKNIHIKKAIQGSYSRVTVVEALLEGDMIKDKQLNDSCT